MFLNVYWDYKLMLFEASLHFCVNSVWLCVTTPVFVQLQRMYTYEEYLLIFIMGVNGMDIKHSPWVVERYKIAAYSVKVL